MLKKWKIIAAVLASSFVLTEASKSVHFNEEHPLAYECLFPRWERA